MKRNYRRQQLETESDEDYNIDSKKSLSISQNQISGESLLSFRNHQKNNIDEFDEISPIRLKKSIQSKRMTIDSNEARRIRFESDFSKDKRDFIKLEKLNIANSNINQKTMDKWHFPEQSISLPSLEIPNKDEIYQAKKKRLLAKNLQQQKKSLPSPDITYHSSLHSYNFKGLNYVTNQTLINKFNIGLNVYNTNKLAKNARSPCINFQIVSDNDEVNEWNDFQTLKYVNSDIHDSVTRFNLLTNNTCTLNLLDNHELETLDYFSASEFQINTSPISIYLSDSFDSNQSPSLKNCLQNSSFESLKFNIQNHLDSSLSIFEKFAIELQRYYELIFSVLAKMNVNQMRIKKDEQLFKFLKNAESYVQNLLNCFNDKRHLIISIQQNILKSQKILSNALYEERKNILIQKDEFYNNDDSLSYSNSLFDFSSQNTSDNNWMSDSQNSDIINSAISIYNIEKQAELSKALQVFCDVKSEFSDINFILRFFEEWKSYDAVSFDHSYVMLFLPRILSILIKLEIVGCDIVDINSTNLFNSNWFTILNASALNRNLQAGFRSKRSSALVTSLLELSVIPMVSNATFKIWDPLSSCQTYILSRLVKEIFERYEGAFHNSAQVNHIKTTFYEKLKSACEYFYIDVISKESISEKISFERQFWLGIKLGQNIKCFESILDDDILKSLILDELLNKSLIISLYQLNEHKNVLNKIQKIFDILPEAIKLGQHDPSINTLIRCIITTFEKMLNEIEKNKFQNNTEFVTQKKQILHLLKCLSYKEAERLWNKYK